MVTSLSTPASSAPATSAPGGSTTDPEGGSPSLLAALEKASRGYSDAKAKLIASRKRQYQLIERQRAVEKQVEALAGDVNELAASAYRGGNADALTQTLDSGSVATFIDKSSMLDQLSRQNIDKIRGLRAARADLASQKKRIDAEIRTQQAQEQTMGKRKADAERALGVSGGGGSTGFGGGSARASRSAPRRADGTFAPQSCSLDDPTSSGCLTPRTMNALQQAKAAGFTRFTACHRGASFGEHPLGRACDFAAAPGTFGGVATGGDRTYGNRLADYFISNSDRLGVLYVIWFRQIWLPGVGWRAYTRGNGSPSSDHTNHVHLSVQ
jgi:hypothetical protein